MCCKQELLGTASLLHARLMDVQLIEAPQFTAMHDQYTALKTFASLQAGWHSAGRASYFVWP